MPMMNQQFAWINILKQLALISLLIDLCYADCNGALGMEDKRIKDDQITTSNWLYQEQSFNLYYRSKYGRLNNRKLGGGGWCSGSIQQFHGSYIEIDLLKNTRITALASQGRGIGNEYIDEYGIMYKRDNDTDFREYRERGRWHIFAANTDTHTIVKNSFKYPIIARKIRVVPQGDLFSIYCGRFEIYGCTWNKQQDQLISYQLPVANDFQGVKTTDSNYDGATAKLLSFKAKGLGKLTDDEEGTSYIGNSTSSKWIAYRKRNNFSPFFQFNFASKRRFSVMKFHILNKDNNIRVFLQVKILFSNDGINFDRSITYVTSDAARLSIGAFIITVPINHIVAKYVKCVFTQPKEWMMFSEVYFTTDSPNAPLPTKPPLLTKKPAVITERNQPTSRSTEETQTTSKPTPRLLFSLPPKTTTNDNENTIPSFTKATENKVDKLGNDGNESFQSPSSSSQKKGTLSFPIIIAIVLGAVVVSVIIAVLVVRQVRRMDKAKKRPKPSDQRPVRPTVPQEPEFHELLIKENTNQPMVMMKPRITNDSGVKLILDSGYTSHGSGGGGSVKDSSLQDPNGSSV